MNKFPQYSEFSIARCLMLKKFHGMLMAIDNTYHAGDEADLLLVTPSLKLIDVEIKISRQDLKADRAKDKWRSVPPYYHHGPQCPEIVREWPRGIWKHYYCVAEPIWQDSLLEFVAPRSGVFTISIDENGGYRGITVRKKCKANPGSKPITPEALVKLAYLANFRMHEAYRKLDERCLAHTEEIRWMEERVELQGLCRRSRRFDIRG